MNRLSILSLIILLYGCTEQTGSNSISKREMIVSPTTFSLTVPNDGFKKYTNSYRIPIQIQSHALKAKEIYHIDSIQVLMERVPVSTFKNTLKVFRGEQLRRVLSSRLLSLRQKSLIGALLVPRIGFWKSDYRVKVTITKLGSNVTLNLSYKVKSNVLDALPKTSRPYIHKENKVTLSKYDEFSKRMVIFSKLNEHEKAKKRKEIKRKIFFGR